MYLIQLLIPLYNNDQQHLPGELYDQARSELTEKFGGLTVYTRAPATGLWKEDASNVVRDDIVIYEIMAEELDREWWQRYRMELEERFAQKALIIRATHFEQL
jgi:hypothetical protein